MMIGCVLLIVMYRFGLDLKGERSVRLARIRFGSNTIKDKNVIYPPVRHRLLRGFGFTVVLLNLFYICSKSYG